MAEPEQAVRTRLLASAGVTTYTGTRVYGGDAPQATKDAHLVIRRMGGLREQGMTVDFGLPHPVLQIDAFASTYATTRLLAAAVHTALNRHEDAVSTPELIDVIPENEGFDLPFDRETGLYQFSRDYQVWCRP